MFGGYFEAPAMPEMPEMPGMPVGMPEMPEMPGMPAMPSLGVWSDLSDEDLRKKFDEIDTDGSGVLSRDEVKAAMKDLGRTDDEIKDELRRMKKNEYDFDDFRLMAKPPQQASMIHSVPGLGAITAAMSDSYYGQMSEGELRDAFKKIDVDGSGKLSKTELADAMRQLGKPERTVSAIIDPLPEGKELDFAQFKELVQPSGGGGYMPAMPVMPGFSTFSFGSWGNMTDDELKAKFDELDVDGSGQLSKAEVRKALQQLGRSETEIEEEVGRMNRDELSFEDFRLMAKPPAQASVLHSVPGLGVFTTAVSESYYGEMNENDLRDAFKKIDVDGNGALNKKELKDAMRQLGKPDRAINERLNTMADDEELDFDSFKELVQPKPLISGFPTFG